MATTIRDYFAEGTSKIDELTLYGYSVTDAETVRRAIEEVLPP